LRAEAGVTLDAAAEELDCSRQKVWRIESGLGSVRAVDVRAMCQLYGVAPRLTEALAGLAGDSDRPAPEPLPPAPAPEAGEPLSAAAVHATLADVLPEDGIVVLESPTSTLALRTQLRISRPGSYFFGAGGGLGFGLAAAIGVQLARPQRRVVCVVGEGSAQYAISALWTAAAYRVPVTFLVVRNDEYGILKWFADLEQVTGAPGLDLPALETAKVAEGYGVPSRQVAGRDELREALASALDSDEPRLVEVRVNPGMSWT
jgi:benzoylformate decarboxylase